MRMCLVLTSTIEMHLVSDSRLHIPRVMTFTKVCKNEPGRLKL